MRTNRPYTVSRRTFIKLGGITVGLVIAGNPLKLLARPADPNARRVVLLEMNGGNDGLNTVIPYSDGAYYDLRQRLAIPESDVLKLDSDFGLHPALTDLKNLFDAGQVAIFQGIGHPNPDLSHFAMQDCWRSGDLLGASNTDGTGWLGRLLDLVANSSAPLAGLSLSTSVGPVLIGRGQEVAAAAAPDAGTLDVPPDIADIYRSAFQGMGAADGSDPSARAAARAGIQASIGLSEFLSQLGPPNPAYPDSNTARLLAFAAQILATNDWIRVIHIPLPLDFDTHEDELNRQEANLREVGQAVGAFVPDLQSLGLADNTVIMTTSEFGRRAEDNGSVGTDHGTASVQFVIGKPVKRGFYSAPSSLRDLDGNGNLVATIGFQDLLATVVEGWMGVPAGEVLSGGMPHSIFS